MERYPSLLRLKGRAKSHRDLKNKIDRKEKTIVI
jgi:ppGpp synthetase/RelA/SpoT-type nucleotidyltranferase